MRVFSTKLVNAMLAQQTGEVLLFLVDINCNGTHLRFVNDLNSVTYNANTYTPMAMQLKLPDDVDGQVPVGTLKVDNTDLQLMIALQATKPPAYPTVTIYFMLASQIGTLEFPTMTYDVRDMDDDEGTITLSLTKAMTSNEQFPKDTFNSYNFPSLFINTTVGQESL